MPSSFVDSRINQNLEVATEYFRALVSKRTYDADNKLNASAGSLGFIPFNINFTMDGISGIKIYNKLSVDTSFMPPGYTNTMEFIVTGIDHKIQNGDWETNIKTTFIPKTGKIDNYITSSLTIFGQIETPPPTPPSSTTPNLSGPGLAPVKALILSVESGGDYEIYNYGPSGGTGIRTVTPGSKYNSASATKLTDKTVSWINSQFQRVSSNSSGVPCNPGSPGSAFAVGKYQTIPCTLKGAINALGIGSQPFDAATQEKIGDWLVLTKRSNLGAYLKGTNTGTQTDLERAVQDLGLEFASLPIITKNSITWGNVVTGTGNKGNYGGSGPNPDTVSTTVGTVVKALIKSRINYSGNNPSFIPSYYN